MIILGIDYGRAKIGIAIAEGSLAEPKEVIRVKGWEDALEKVDRLSKELDVSQIIVGVTEGEMGKEQERFAINLGEKVQIPVETQDETLSTIDAQEMAINAGMGPKKRRLLEDAFAASLVLQSWLDSNKK